MNAGSKWEVSVAAIVCTVAGLAAGWWIAGGSGKTPDKPQQADDAPRRVTLPEATLANLGVRVGKLKKSSFFRTVSVAAVVVDAPLTEQPVFAPIGGCVERIEVDPGTVVPAGRTVVTLVRDPLPRPTLTLTADILRPAQERLHDSVLTLRKATGELRIARTELERVERFTGRVGGRDLPIIPKQRAIDLRYQLSRAETAYQEARLELEKHGLTEEQISAVEKGGPLPVFNEHTWQRALAHNGLWTPAAQKLFNTLPERLRALPWVTATVGELAASGLVSGELTEWIANSGVAGRFLEVGVLLQRGHTLEDLKRLHTLNALEPVVAVRARSPQGDGAWDVLDVLTKPGAKVAAGDPLVRLRDPRRLFLRTEPVGGEVAAILQAAQHGHAIVARPLIEGAGPVLEELAISYVQRSRENDGTVGFIEVRNSVSAEIDRGQGVISRTWALREGLRYLLRVPTQRLDDVFVLPASAVTEDGPNRIVFLQDGDGFKPVPVVVAYQDHEVVVLPVSKKQTLFVGDAVVHSGAFELGLALKGGDAVDAHAGHSH